MGVTGVLAKWIGGKLGGMFKVPVKDGIMLPYTFKYSDKIADLAVEKNAVSKDYLRELMDEAHEKRDLDGLKTIRRYLSEHKEDYPDSFLNKVMEYGREIRFREMLQEHLKDPFALIEKVGDWLC